MSFKPIIDKMISEYPADTLVIHVSYMIADSYRSYVVVEADVPTKEVAKEIAIALSKEPGVIEVMHVLGGIDNGQMG